MLTHPDTQAPTPLLLSVVEAARLLAVGRTTVYELIGRGDLPVVHIGRACRVPIAAVEEYVERLRAEERATPRPYPATP